MHCKQRVSACFLGNLTCMYIAYLSIMTIFSADPAAVRSTIFEIKFVLQKGVHCILCIYIHMYPQRNEVKTWSPCLLWHSFEQHSLALHFQTIIKVLMPSFVASPGYLFVLQQHIFLAILGFPFLTGSL